MKILKKIKKTINFIVKWTLTLFIVIGPILFINDAPQYIDLGILYYEDGQFITENVIVTSSFSNYTYVTPHVGNGTVLVIPYTQVFTNIHDSYNFHIHFKNKTYTFNGGCNLNSIVILIEKSNDGYYIISDFKIPSTEYDYDVEVLSGAFAIVNVLMNNTVHLFQYTYLHLNKYSNITVTYKNDMSYVYWKEDVAIINYADPISDIIDLNIFRNNISIYTKTFRNSVSTQLRIIENADGTFSSRSTQIPEYKQKLQSRDPMMWWVLVGVVWGS